MFAGPHVLAFSTRDAGGDSAYGGRLTRLGCGEGLVSLALRVETYAGTLHDQDASFFASIVS
jgi:hypothetical protein